MDISFLLKGFSLGFLIAAPVGPIGLLCIRRTLAEGRLAGLATGLGAATADAVYGCVAGFGLTLISSMLITHAAGLRLVGGLFLCYLGVKTFLAKPGDKAAPDKGRGLTGAYASTFFLTLTNPLTILSFVAIFAGMGLANPSGNYLSAGVFVLGVFLGSACWWLLLSAGVSLLRGKFTPQALVWVNRISGAIISGFGLYALVGLI
jgi:threonine/homoserine/homoserine lactone efflux protein